MHTTTKAGLLVALTFVLGGITGMLGGGALRQRLDGPEHRPPRPPPDEGGRGFVAQTLDLLQPRDSVQIDALLPHLAFTDERNRDIVTAARERMRAELDSLRVQIAPLLNAEQLERFDSFKRRSVAGRGLGGPPGLGGRPPGARPPRRGPPPDGRRPPSPEPGNSAPR